MDAELRALHLDSLVRMLEMFIVASSAGLMLDFNLKQACLVVPFCVFFFILIRIMIPKAYNLRKRRIEE